MKNIPGYVDLQVNGHNGVDFSSLELTESDFLRASEELMATGTIVFLPTVITSDMAVYRRNLPLIRRAVSKAGLEKNIPGLHLEGPFLCDKPGAIGCHNPAWVQAPTPAAVDELIRIAEGFIKIFTVAAEVPGMDKLIEHAVSQRITVSIGHHLADKPAIDAAVRAGATALTHLGNGIPNQLDRHRNPIWYGLAEDALTAMLITDGHHLPPEFIKCAIRIKGVDKTVVVSDAAPVTGLKPGKYHILGNDAVLEANGKFHNPAKGYLCGSASTMSDCMRYLASLDLLSEAELQQVGYYNPLKLINHQL